MDVLAFNIYNLTTIAYTLYTDGPIYYFILLASVSLCELIPLHVHSVRAFIKPLNNMNVCFVHFSLFLSK